MTAEWASLEGRVINGVFPLLRLMAGTERSAVFLSRTASDPPSDLALKLVPATTAQAERLLPRWRASFALDHPHLLRLIEAGECELREQRYLYLAMEYAEQTLAELLEHRALAPDEVRAMLGPTLQALAFLHGSKRAQGGLKPSNVLVVGEQVKLASDAIGPASDVAINGGARGSALSPYQPPEAAGGARSTAGDVWALGVTTCEALSRRRPAGLHAIGGSIALPADLPPSFAEMISKCLSRNPEDRPDVASLQAWLDGAPLTPMPAPTQNIEATNEAQTAKSSPSTRLVIRAELMPEGEITESVELKARWLPRRLLIAGVVLVAIVAAGIYVFTSDEAPSPVARVPAASAPVAGPDAAAEAPRRQTPTLPAPARAPAPAPVPASASASSASAPAPAPEVPPPMPPPAAPDEARLALDEVLPVVPRSASNTIRGTVRVSVRVIVDAEGNVVAATSEDPGPSRYFERLSLEAAKQWRFAPAESGATRLMLVKFNYTRSGPAAQASPIP